MNAKNKNTTSSIFSGVTFRSFTNKTFYEIAFFGVSHSHQMSGYGRLLMNKLKRICQNRDILYLFTYADDGAVGFFRKNGFTDKITIQPK
jgi:histone acetyltransferase